MGSIETDRFCWNMPLSDNDNNEIVSDDDMQERRRYLRKTIVNTYEGSVKDRKFLNRVPFIEKFGATAVNFCVSIQIPLFFAIDFWGESLELVGFLEYFWVLILFLHFMLISSVGKELYDDIDYVKTTKCKNCDKNFAYEERENPVIKEVSTPESYSVMITRYWKCKYCGFEDSTESPENIKASKGAIRNNSKLTPPCCSNCGKKHSYIEFRRPDEKKIYILWNREIITTRYYKCDSCGHVEVKKHEEFQTSSV